MQSTTPSASEWKEHDAFMRRQFLLGLQGDNRAYHAFMERLSGDLRGYFRKRLSSMPDEAEDLVQEVLLAIHNQRHTYQASQSISAWVYAIAKYKLIDRLRRRNRHDIRQVSWEDELGTDGRYDGSSDASEATSAQYDLDQLLARLPAKQRVPIVCTKIEGLTVAETAERLGISESSVKVTVHRGLKTLARLIRGDL